MTDTPGYKISVSFKIAVLSLVCSNHFGDALSDRRLLGNYKFHPLFLL